jgi:predicted CoA-binding protein
VRSQAEAIEKILTETRTIAVVGLSSRSQRAGYYVPAYLQEQGYRIIPVNPYLDRALGEKAYPNLETVPEPVDLVLLFRRSEYVPPLVEEAIEIGAQAIWMQLGIRHEEAAAKAEQAGLDVVMDACMLVEHRRRPAIGPLRT